MNPPKLMSEVFSQPYWGDQLLTLLLRSSPFVFFNSTFEEMISTCEGCTRNPNPIFKSKVSPWRATDFQQISPP